METKFNKKNKKQVSNLRAQINKLKSNVSSKSTDSEEYSSENRGAPINQYVSKLIYLKMKLILIIIVKIALYTQTNSGVAFRLNLVSFIWNIKYCPTKANPDIWIRPEI